ncbi:N-6 DNA methylase [Listeria welshimeri]|nr:N-6 DNA methylase [Listeria welshimeri]MBC1667448.1 N-6 DNA methylase [Listeria welshimeri]MBC1697410.1 N-6 DNA methylase [Listeria welshimeri]
MNKKYGGNKLITKWKLEDDVNDFVKKKLEDINLKKLIDYNVESSMSDYMKEALKGSAKTTKKTLYGKPDFHIEKYEVPVIIENKLGNKNHCLKTKNGIKKDEKSIKKYAVNGAIYYAQNMIGSGKYSEVIAIGISGENEEDTEISIYYVFGANVPPKYMGEYTSLNFLENEKSFKAFYQDASLSEKEKHRILINSQTELKFYARNLNKLMNNFSIPVEQRVIYVSGMLLSMQDLIEDGKIIDEGLMPKDLKGIQTEKKRDGKKVVDQIEEYLKLKNIPSNKRSLMLSSFKNTISLDADRDIPIEVHKEVSSLIDGKASITRQIFEYIYQYVFLSIDGTSGHLDIMGEMYSVFLKYALGDGKEIGIVLTPPYITKMMAEILEVNLNSRVMDIATGSAGFLIASMELMIRDAEKKYSKDTTRALKKIEKIKSDQLLGVEIDAKMYTLATTNMILRGDGSSNIQKGNTFELDLNVYSSFAADKMLLNPPFSFQENGLPFLEFGLDNMQKGGQAAIIIQDSAGSGKAIETAKRILKKHKMLGSIKMPVDTFQPSAGVQTSIYIFESGTPHDFKKDIVKFIDFQNDGYKRTSRGTLMNQDFAEERYQDICKIFKLGSSASKDHNFHKNLWDLEDVYVEDFITSNGNDWNFERHRNINTEAKEEDFVIAVKKYYALKITKQLSGEE